MSGLKISRQSICEISAEYGDVFDEGEFSGILGLAFPSGAAFDQVPLFDNIMNQGLIGYNLFAFYYSINE